MNIDPPCIPESETRSQWTDLQSEPIDRGFKPSSVKEPEKLLSFSLSLSDLFDQIGKPSFHSHLFARISYLSVRWKLAPKATFAFQTYVVFSKKVNSQKQIVPIFIYCHALARILKARLTPGADSINELFLEMPAEMQPMEESIGGFKRVMDGVIQTIDFKTNPDIYRGKVRRRYVDGSIWQSSQNDLFTSNLEAAVKILQLPCLWSWLM